MSEKRAIFKARLDLIVSTKLDWKTVEGDAWVRLHSFLREGVRRGLIVDSKIRGVKRVAVNFDDTTGGAS